MKALRSLVPAFIIFAGVVSDQASKLWALEAFSAGKLPMDLTWFFSLTLAFNKGVSFSFLASNSETMPFILAGFSIVVSLGLIIWLLREDSLLTKTGISFIIAGALGNALDRVRIGAVIDFLDFHAYGWYFPVFNIADVFINVGVGLILLQVLFFSPKDEA